MGAKTKAPKTGTAPVNVNRKADIQRLHAEHTQEQITLMKKQSKFSNGNGAYFGAWNAQLNSFRLRLWNTSTKELILDYTGQSGEQMTAFSWPAVSSDDSMITTDQLILALGLSSGSIQLFDVAQKRVVGTLTSPISSASITDFIFASPSNSIGYSTMEDGSLFEWDLRQFKVKRSVKLDQKLTRLALSSDGSLLAVAGHQIQLYKTSDFSLVKTCIGHPASVTHLSFTSDKLHLVSLAQGERVTGTDSKRVVLSMDSEAQFMCVSNEGFALAIDQKGQIVLWNAVEPSPTVRDEENKRKKKKAKQIALSPQGMVRILNEETLTDIMPIYSALFVDNSLLTARGSFLNPIFEKLDFLTPEGTVSAESIFKRSLASDALLKGVTIDNHQKSQSMSKMKISSGEVVEISKPNVSLDEPSIEEKLQQASLQEGSVNQATDKHERVKKIDHSASSLHQMLQQAITSEDRELLERCLTVRDSKMITTSIQRLSAPLVPNLLDQILDRLRNKPQRGLQLTEWIRAVLIYHSSYLLSVPSLNQKLAHLYQSLEARVSTYEKMLQLSGRIDMILCQSQLREAASASNEESQKALITFEEGEEDEDMMLLDDASMEETESDEEEGEEDEDSMDGELEMEDDDI